MNVIIAGSRKITDYKIVKATIENSGFNITQLISGHCPLGVDTLGEKWAIENNIPIKIFPANWKNYGPAAGPIRNSQMIEYSDALIAIWDGTSKGTKDIIKKAKKKGLKIYLLDTSIQKE